MSVNRIYGDTTEFTSRSDNSIITLQAGPNEILQLNGVFSESGLILNHALGAFVLNAGAETILVQNTWTKLGSTTTTGAQAKFTMSDNKALYIGTIPGIFEVSYSVSVTGTNTENLLFGVAKSDTIVTASITSNTVLAANPRAIFSGTFLVQLAATEYLEIYAKNATSSNPVTVTMLSLVVVGPL